MRKRVDRAVLLVRPHVNGIGMIGMPDHETSVGFDLDSLKGFWPALQTRAQRLGNSFLSAP